MQLVESETVEFKCTFTPKLLKAVVAFAKSNGGTLDIGIAVFGSIVGVDDIDATMLQCSNAITDGVYPDVSEITTVSALDIDGVALVKIEVEAGPYKPYCLCSKGFVPAGVYRRLGPANVPIEMAQIRSMIKRTDGDYFETARSHEQSLTFFEAERAFRRAEITFDQTSQKNLGLIDELGFYTNLALLVSDQNPFAVRAGLFNDDAYTEFIDRQDGEGSIFRQIEDIERFLNISNATRMYFVPGRLDRIDKDDYPREAVREGILNLFIHRDYESSVASLIKMSRTALEFTNAGGPQHISVEEALAGGSDARNPKLQLLFLRLGMVEAFGTGLKGIRALYEAEGLEPEVCAYPAMFRLSLPNVNAVRNSYLTPRGNSGPNLRGDYSDYEQLEREGALPPDVSQAFASVRAQREGHVSMNGDCGHEVRAKLVEELGFDVACKASAMLQDVSDERRGGYARALIRFALERPRGFTRQDASDALGTGRDVTLRVINGLLEEGALVKEGRARATRYRAVGQV